jgi:hypothetical protein
MSVAATTTRYDTAIQSSDTNHDICMLMPNCGAMAISQAAMKVETCQVWDNAIGSTEQSRLLQDHSSTVQALRCYVTFIKLLTIALSSPLFSTAFHAVYEIQTCLPCARP